MGRIASREETQHAQDPDSLRAAGRRHPRRRNRSGRRSVAELPGRGDGIGGPQANGTQFVGSGVGSAGDRAHWQASVSYDALANCATVGSTCALTGGTFTLRSQGSQAERDASPAAACSSRTPHRVAGGSSSRSPATSPVTPAGPDGDAHDLPLPVARSVRRARGNPPGLAGAARRLTGGGGIL